MNDLNEKEKMKVMFIYNAIEDGWSVKKCDKLYIFKKKHKNEKKYFSEKYLQQFILKYNNSLK
jgi:hypothetical protein|tara:strand:- start:732 stop:920 length:189 start_codon:yes stop_codon:yes gene_type:complete